MPRRSPTSSTAWTPRRKPPDGTTALHWAVYHDDADLVARLIKAGADVNAANDYGSTPLTEAATAGDAAVIKRCSTPAQTRKRRARTAQPR